MAKKKKRVAKKGAKLPKKTVDAAERPEKSKGVRADRLAETSEPIDPTGSCRYADTFGQMQCESPVTKTYCDSKSGQFVPNGRC
jgi:hypothetical protein